MAAQEIELYILFYNLRYFLNYVLPEYQNLIDMFITLNQYNYEVQHYKSYKT